MLKVILIGILLTTLACGQDNVIDNGQRLLTQLVVDAEKNLADLKTFWTDTEPLYQRSVDGAKSTVSAQNTLCKQRDADVVQGELDVKKTNDFIAWISERIADNTKRLALLEQDRCDQTKNYVNGLKNRKITLKLIDFLRKAIQAKDSLALPQLKAITDKMKIFFQLYSDKHFNKLLTMSTEIDMSAEKLKQDGGVDMSVQARSQSDIGTKHIDDGKQQIKVADFDSSDRKDWAAYKTQILELLDSFETEMRSNMKKAQDDEVAAGVALAEFKIQIEREIQQLDKQLAIEAENLGKFESKLVGLKSLQSACNSDFESVNKQLTEEQENYAQKLQQFNEKKASIEEEINTFKTVAALYNSKLAGAEGGYKDRVQDYAADKKFDNAYGKRDVDNFDFIKL